MIEEQKKNVSDIRKYFPMLVSESGDDSPQAVSVEECLMTWQKFDAIPAESQDILTAKELPLAISDYERKWQLSTQDTPFISLCVRKYYFREWSLQECGNKIYSHFNRNDSDTGKVHGMISSFQKDILTVRPKNDATTTATNTTEHLSLLPALGKYPKLGEQIMTRERLQLKNQPEPVRPNLTNWLRVYRDELGVGYHDPMTRGKFIFDSVNCKKLSSEERELLNIVLRSVEENMPIDIDPAKMEIVFPEFHASEKDRPTPRPPVSIVSASAMVLPKAVPEASRPIQQPSVPTSGAVPVKPLSPPAITEMMGAGKERPQPRPFIATPPVLHSPPPAPARRPVSFVPSPPPDLPVSGSFSFSSPHSLPVESEGEGGLSIRRPDVASLPSGHTAYNHQISGKVESVPSNLSRDGKNNVIQSAAPDMNPFHIHPVGTRGESPDPGFDAGRTVNLRGDK
jgi:hypothetical protein